MVRIDQDNLLSLLGSMEGSDWVEEQHQKPTSPYGVFRLINAWELKLQSQDKDDPTVPLTDFCEESGEGPVIYGSGGWRRYHVSGAGEVRLIASSARKESQEKALSLGFRLT